MDQKTKDKINLIIGVSIYILFIYCGLETFVSIYNNGELFMKMNMFEVKGYYIVMLGLIINLYALYTKKKNIFYISSIMTIAGFLYTFYTVRNLNSVLDGLNVPLSIQIKYEIGYYLYIIDFSFVIVNMILSFLFITDSKLETKLQNDKLEYNKDGVNYILTNYIFGIKNAPNLYNKLAVLASKENSKCLNILISDENAPKISIEDKDIKNITIKTTTIISNKEHGIKNDDLANFSLLYSMFGVWGLAINELKFKDKVKTYTDLNYTKVYEIKVNINSGQEFEALMFHSKNNPTDFFKDFQDKVTYL